MCKKYHKLARPIYIKSTILVAWGGRKETERGGVQVVGTGSGGRVKEAFSFLIIFYYNYFNIRKSSKCDKMLTIFTPTVGNMSVYYIILCILLHLKFFSQKISN